MTPAPSADAAPPRQDIVAIPPLGLEGVLTMPPAPIGIVVFAHGSGSSRFSPRNRLVAAALHEAGLATLLFDLLLEAEARDRMNVFDIGLLAARLAQGIDLVSTRPDTAALPIGLFGASTGAAAALSAAASHPAVRAVVSRGGRPDLAAPHLLGRVAAPTLLIVGSEDREVLALNRDARLRMGCPTELAVIPGATHLFEETGTLEHAARLAATWFRRHLSPPARHAT